MKYYSICDFRAYDFRALKMIKQFIVPSYPYDAQNPDTLSPEVQKKVLDAFEVFDHEQNKTVDAREIGTIIRSLGTFIYFITDNRKN